MEFLFDIVCPYAWMAANEVEALGRRCGVPVLWRPVLLGGLLKALGEEDGIPRSSRWSPAREAMAERDVSRMAQLRGLAFARNPAHPVRSLDAMRLLQATPPDRRPALALRLFEAIHVLGLDLADRSLLSRVAAEHGLSMEAVDDPATKAELRASTDAALAEGIFGVPTFRALGRFWWGADRMHLVEAALRGYPRRDDAPTDLGRDGAVAVPRRPSATPSRVEVFHDASSPYSYLGVTQIQRVAADHGAELVWRPMLLGALFREIGSPNVPIAAMNSSRAAYLARDLADHAAWWGVPFSFPSCFPVRTVQAMRVCLVEPRAAAPIYEALWARGRDIGNPAVLEAVLVEHGLARSLLEAAEGEGVKAQLRANTERAAALGACGAPSFYIESQDRPGILIWGQDRLDLVGACLDGWRPPAESP